MKQFYLRHRNTLLMQSLRSGSILSLFIYATLRCLYYEFPMNWIEEVMFFTKTFMVACFLIVTATGGAAMLYRTILSMRRSN